MSAPNTDQRVNPVSPPGHEKYHVGSPNVVGREGLLRQIEGILDRNQLTNGGPLVQEFEARLREITGVKHCIPMCNGTVALEIMARALDLSGEVICPAFTFVATAHALQWQGITPVFCDIDPLTHNIDPNCVEKLITPRTTGILAVDLWGRPCHVEALQDIADRHGLKLCFDAAHAFGCSHGGRPVGNFGAAEVFSFHATKFIHSFEGGAIATNDDELARKIRLMMNFGFTWYDQVDYIGMNGKMCEVAAAMGLTSLDAMSTIVDHNKRNHERYLERLALLSCLKPVIFDDGTTPNYQYVVLEVQPDCPVPRDRLVEALHARNIIARRYFYPGCHRMEPYKSQRDPASWGLAHTEDVASRVVVLPTGTTMTNERVDRVCDAIREII